MKHLSHPTTLDPATAAQLGPLASWPQSLVTVTIEAQAKPGAPWTPSQKNKPIKADDPASDATVEAWKVEGDKLIAAGKLHAWRIVLTAEALVHCFSVTQPVPPRQTGTNAHGVKPPLPHTVTAEQDEAT